MFRLSKKQQHVVDYRGGHLQVIACAGSGKTESIARRVAALIGEGVEPASIIAFTFTEKAAAELKDRVYRCVADTSDAHTANTGGLSGSPSSLVCSTRGATSATGPFA